MLSLERLADEEVTELVEATLAGPLEPRALELVAGHADGNPFFVEEVLADLLDRGLLERGDRDWSLRDGAVDLGIPDSVQGVLAARIDLLPAEAKEALQAASVIGRSFTPAGLAALTGSSAAVRTLAERGFVRPTQPELVFKHALTRDVAYGSLPKASRARLHAAFARWLEADGPAAPRAGVLAHHYSEAVAPGIADLAWRDRDEELGQLTAAALRWLRRAAELSLARFDLDDALLQLHRAAELAPGDAELWHAIGRVNALKFDGEAMWPAMERAIELTEGAQELAELYAELTFESTMRGGMWKRPLDHDLVETWLARSLELADAGSAAQARGLVAKATWEDDAEAAEQAVALAERLDDPVLLSYAYWARSGAAFIGFDFHEADRWAQRRFELLDRLTDPDKIAHIQFYGATAALAAGRPDEAQTLVRKHDLVASRLSTHHEVHALGVLLFVEEALGNWDEVRRLQRRVERAVADNQGTPCVLNPRTLFSCAVACGELGLDGEAQRLEEAAVEQGFQDAGMGFWLDPPPAHLALLRGDLERLDALLESSGATWHWSLDGSLYAAGDEARGPDRARPDARGRGGRNPTSSGGDVSRAVRAAHARSGAERPRADRTGGRTLRGDGARLARGEDARARAGLASPEVDHDLDVIRLPLQRLRPACQRHPSGDQTREPCVVCRGECRDGLLPMASTGVHASEQELVVQHHRAVERRRVGVQVGIGVHDARQAHDPAALEPAGGGPPDRPQPGALEHDVDVDTDVRRVAGVVARAQPLDEVTLRALQLQVDDMHLVPALDAEQAREQADRPRARDERPAADEEGPFRDLIDLVPGLGHDRRRLQEHSAVAELDGHAHGKVGLDPPELAAVPVAPVDPALGEEVVAAHVPLAGRARGTWDRVGPADDPHDAVAGLESRSGRAFHDLAEPLVTDDQPVVPLGGRAVHAVGDLVIGAAHADQHASHQEPAVLDRRGGHILHAGGSLGSREDGHRAHPPIVAGERRAPIIHPGLR